MTYLDETFASPVEVHVHDLFVYLLDSGLLLFVQSHLSQQTYSHPLLQFLQPSVFLFQHLDFFVFLLFRFFIFLIDLLIHCLTIFWLGRFFRLLCTCILGLGSLSFALLSIFHFFNLYLFTFRVFHLGGFEFAFLEELDSLLNAGFEERPVLYDRLEVLDGKFDDHACDLGGLGTDELLDVRKDDISNLLFVAGVLGHDLVDDLAASREIGLLGALLLLLLSFGFFLLWLWLFWFRFSRLVVLRLFRLGSLWISLWLLSYFLVSLGILYDLFRFFLFLETLEVLAVA